MLALLFLLTSLPIPYRTSGVTDHYAMNDEHALSITRRIIRNLNYTSFLFPHTHETLMLALLFCSPPYPHRTHRTGLWA